MVDEKELPEKISSRIDPVDFDKDLSQRSVALEFVHGDRPYYNVTKMHAAIGSDVSTDTVRSRMDELYERDVLERELINNGDIYWLKRKNRTGRFRQTLKLNRHALNRRYLSGEEKAMSNWGQYPSFSLSLVQLSP